MFSDQSHHFQLEYHQQSIFLAYCCYFSFLHHLSSIQSIISLIHNYLYKLCSHYNHNSHCPIIDMCTLLHSLSYCSFLFLAINITPFIGFMVMKSLFQLEGGNVCIMGYHAIWLLHSAITCWFGKILVLHVYKSFSYWNFGVHHNLLLFKTNTMDSRTLYAK